MDDKRKAIIINEILYWKKNKLLPHNYCDYLLALYSGGDHGNKSLFQRVLKVSSSKKASIIMNVILLVTLSLVVFYFTQNTTVLQISFIILFLFLAFLAFYRVKRDDQFPNIFLPMILLLILIVTVYTTIMLVSRHQLLVNMIIILNIISWFIIGFKKRLTYLLIISVLAFIFLLIRFFL